MKRNGKFTALMIFVPMLVLFTISCQIGGYNETDTIQIRITGISASLFEQLDNYYIHCWLNEEGHLGLPLFPIAGFSSYTHDLKTGGTGDNRWISFYLYETASAGGEHWYIKDRKYSGTGNYYDLELSANGKVFFVTDLFYKARESVYLEINELNSLPFDLFYDY